MLGNDARKLKATSGWNNNGNGTNDYGFSALPGGYSTGRYFFNVGDVGYWWSATENNNLNAYSWLMNYDDSTYGGNGSKSTLFSVRCLQD